MILRFDMPPLARGQGLCDIDRVWFRVTQKNFKIMESPGMAELIKPVFRQIEKLELSV